MRRDVEIEEIPDEEEEEEEEMKEDATAILTKSKAKPNSKLKTRANHFRRLIMPSGGGGDASSVGLISRLPDDLFLESFVGGVHVLDRGEMIGETEQNEENDTLRGSDGALLNAKGNQWYSSSKAQSAKARRRHKRSTFHRGEDAIGDTEIHLRIMYQCFHGTVQELLLNRYPHRTDTEEYQVEDQERESTLDSIIDDVFNSVVLTSLTIDDDDKKEDESEHMENA